MKRIYLLTTTAFLLSACAAGGAAVISPEAKSSASIPTDRLPAQNLAPGKCGLFVFAKDEARTFILFAQEGGAAKLFDGAQVALTQTAKSGAAQDKQFPVQSFKSATGEDVMLTLRNAERFEGGTRYPGGLLERVRADGWALKIPVAGLSTCISE